MRWLHGIILFVFIVLSGGMRESLGARAPLEEGRCTLVPVQFDSYSDFIGLTSRTLPPQSDDLPPAVRDLPAGFDRTCYYMLKIVDEKGNVLAADKFQYGWGGTCRYSWRVPSGFKGKFQVRIEMGLGPLEVRHEGTWHSIE